MPKIIIIDYNKFLEICRLIERLVYRLELSVRVLVWGKGLILNGKIFNVSLYN
ncbi:MAG: hypothetical protein GX102_07830 [Porphyromonadaceae bacterium]|nr:hypothetical protein [Porphyromonadaceae bacterium]